MKLLVEDIDIKDVYKDFSSDQELIDFIEESLITPDNIIIDFNPSYSISLESPNLSINAWFVRPSINVNAYPIIQVEYRDRIIFHREGDESSQGWKVFSDDMFNAIYNRIERSKGVKIERKILKIKKALKESFGESEELNTFVAQTEKRFSDYYVVALKVNNRTSERYFAYESAAREYFDNLKKEAQEEMSYYEGAQISLTRVEIKKEEDELDWILIDNDEE